MADFRIRIIVDSSGVVTGTRRVKAGLDDVSNSADKVRAIIDRYRKPIGQVNQGLVQTSRAASQLGNTLRTVFAISAITLAGRAIINLSDAYTNLQNRLRTVSGSTEELNLVTQELFDISNRTRVNFQSAAELYARVGLAVRNLGTTQREALQFTESLNQAILLSGASAHEANNGLIQLSQGLASDTLRGDELRSVLEQLPVVADVISKSLGISRGELRFFGQEGKISAEVVLKAFREAREELAERFAKVLPTIGQAMVVLRNNFITLLQTFNSVTGASTALAVVIVFLANHLHGLAALVELVGVALVVANARGIYGWIIGTRLATASTAAFLTVLNLLRAHPIVAVLIGLAFILREIASRFDLSADTAARLSAVMSRFAAIGSAAFDIFSKALEIVLGLVEKIIEGIVYLLQLIGIELVEAAKVSTDILEQGFTNAGKAAVKFGDDGKNAVDKLSREYLNMDENARNFQNTLKANNQLLDSLRITGTSATNDITTGFDRATSSAQAYAAAARAAGSATSSARGGGGSGGNLTASIDPESLANSFALGINPLGGASSAFQQAVGGLSSAQLKEVNDQLVGFTASRLQETELTTLVRAVQDVTGKFRASSEQQVLDIINRLFNPSSTSTASTSRASSTPTVSTSNGTAADLRRDVFTDAATDRQPVIQITNYFSTPDEMSFRRSIKQFNTRQRLDLQGALP